MKNICNSKRIRDLCLTADKQALLDSIEYDKRTKRILITLIEIYQKYTLDFWHLHQNWDAITKLGHDSSSKKSFITRYGEKKGLELWEEKTAASTQTKEDYVQKYGQEEAIRKLSSRGASLDNYVNRYGEDIGNQKWAEYCVKRSNTYKARKASGHCYPSTGLDHYIDLYGPEEGTARYNAKVSDSSHKNSLAGFIEKYGPEMGPIICKETKTTRNLAKFTSLYGVEQGLEKYKDLNARVAYSATLQGHIDRYGVELGTQKYNETCQRKGYANTLDYYLEKYGDEGKKLFQDRYDKAMSALISSKRVSKWALGICNELAQSINDLYYFGDNEIRISCREVEGLNIYVKPDVFYKGKIIEFNGDSWHANPNIYQADDRPNPLNQELTAAEIWQRDAAKLNLYQSRGYNTLIVWQSDYKRNQKEVIDTCLKFLTN
jgi:hypothetical protein